VALARLRNGAGLGQAAGVDGAFGDILSSAEVQAFASGFPIMVLHLVVTFLLLAGGAALYARLTPWKEIELIRAGNPAAAVAFAGVLMGLAIPLAVSLSVSASVRDILIWGVATVVLQLLAFRVVDVLLTGLPQRIVDGEAPAAVLLVGAKLATALILAAALTG
jgi:putative membrane protein